MENNREFMLKLYRTMQLIRRFEEYAARLYAKGDIKGAVHLYTGEEAIAAGVCANLNPEDYITSTHRGHGHLIAKGGDVKLMMAELFQRHTGYCKGKGGSMHICDLSLGILGSNGIVGAGIPISVGAGHVCQTRDKGQVCACFFGDGATNRGTFHEGINMASIWNLPVIFVCENNYYGISGDQRQMMRVKKISERATAYGIPGVTADGNDVLAVYEATRRAVQLARSGGGPTLLEFLTWRHRGHWEGDPDEWRSKTEHEEWLLKEPVGRFGNLLLEQKLCSREALHEIDQEVLTELDDAVRFASASPEPDERELFTDVYID